MSFPPDTDTPGFAEENKDKPEETRLISEAAGLFSPETVAKTLLNDSLVISFVTKKKSLIQEVSHCSKGNIQALLDLRDLCNPQFA